jgi:hypothetical protein
MNLHRLLMREGGEGRKKGNGSRNGSRNGRYGSPSVLGREFPDVGKERWGLASARDGLFPERIRIAPAAASLKCSTYDQHGLRILN